MAAKQEYHPRTEFRIEAPSGSRKSFRIRFKSPDTQNKWTQLKLPEIDKANDLLKSGVVAADHTKEKLREIMKQQYLLRDRTKQKPKFMSENVRLVEKMWEEKYNRRRLRKMKDPDASRNALMRAVESAGLHPLDTCDLEDLADWLDETLGDKPNVLHRRITWLNSILGWLGREKLEQVERDDGRVRYLNEKEVQSLFTHLGQIQTHYETLARIAFYTGLRLGEIFALLPESIFPSKIHVRHSMNSREKGFKIGSPKNGRDRDAFLPKVVVPVVKKWAAIPLEDRHEWRETNYGKVVRRACLKLYPDNPVRLTRFHDLRHCNAIWLLQKGVQLSTVAQHLGNRQEVCERHYSGFELKKESIEVMKGLVD